MPCLMCQTVSLAGEGALTLSAVFLKGRTHSAQGPDWTPHRTPLPHGSPQHWVHAADQAGRQGDGEEQSHSTTQTHLAGKGECEQGVIIHLGLRVNTLHMAVLCLLEIILLSWTAKEKDKCKRWKLASLRAGILFDLSQHDVPELAATLGQRDGFLFQTLPILLIFPQEWSRDSHTVLTANASWKKISS